MKNYPNATQIKSSMLSRWIILVAGMLLAGAVNSEVLSVGPGKQFVAPSVAAEFAIDGDAIEIDGNGNYQGDVAVWKQNDITIRGINGRPHMQAAGRSVEKKGTWVIKGNNVTVENIEFSESKVPDKNGAGIRQEGANLTIRNCYFHDNENGILAGASKESVILVEYSEFKKNGAGDGQSHNIYIGDIKELVLQFNIFKGAKIGHNVKSRASRNIIKYNIIRDGLNGNASYQIDLPGGGYSEVVGNSIQQGQHAENYALVAYGMEGLRKGDNHLYLVNNTLVNDRHNGIFVKTADNSKAWLYNNLFVGKGVLLEGPGQQEFNILTESPKFIGHVRGDYRLTAKSSAIDKGNIDTLPAELDLIPKYIPTMEMQKKERTPQGSLDVGAYEYLGTHE